MSSRSRSRRSACFGIRSSLSNLWLSILFSSAASGVAAKATKAFQASIRRPESRCPASIRSARGTTATPRFRGGRRRERAAPHAARTIARFLTRFAERHRSAQGGARRAGAPRNRAARSRRGWPMSSCRARPASCVRPPTRRARDRGRCRPSTRRSTSGRASRRSAPSSCSARTTFRSRFQRRRRRRFRRGDCGGQSRDRERRIRCIQARHGCSPRKPSPRSRETGLAAGDRAADLPHRPPSRDSGWCRTAASGASAFTGSRAAGLALKNAADAAGKPIYLEMSSINPVVVLPGALAERGSEGRGGVRVELPDGRRTVLHEPRGSCSCSPMREPISSSTR